MSWPGVIEKYRFYLPVTPSTPVVTLHEGGTPLIPSKALSRDLNLRIYYKFEGLNPTGSFKDRGMTVAISKAVEEGAKAVICASTGNTSASAAAYAARAGLKCFVLIPEGKIARGKLVQALMHHAVVIGIKGNFDQALALVRRLSADYPLSLVNSLNPHRIEGQKTAAFEVCDDLDDSPDYLFIPVGNAGNITAYWKGFKEYFERGAITKKPRLFGFQAAGAAPLVLGHPVERPETVATAIRIGKPARGEEALQAARESGGEIDMVTDEEILKAYHFLAEKEGLFVEPASAASVAGLLKKFSQGVVPPGAQIVCVLTGCGLKDPDTALKVKMEMNIVESEEETKKLILKEMKW